VFLIESTCSLRVVRGFPERQKIDLSTEILRRQVAVDLGGDTRIAVAKDALDGRRIRASHH